MRSSRIDERTNRTAKQIEAPREENSQKNIITKQRKQPVNHYCIQHSNLHAKSAYLPLLPPADLLPPVPCVEDDDAFGPDPDPEPVAELVAALFSMKRWRRGQRKKKEEREVGECGR